MYLITEIQSIPINDTETAIINLINGATDIIENEIFNNIKVNLFEDIETEVIDALINRRYLFNSKIEYDLFIKEMDNSINKSEVEGIPSFLVVPTYACNLKCTYCYEQSYHINHKMVIDDFAVIDKQFEFIGETIQSFKKHTGTDFNNKEVTITLMGGEPLLQKNYKIIKYILDKIKENNYSFNAITNGVDLDSFIEDLSQYGVDHIQITLDGTKDIHDKRRIFHNGSGSFDIIIKNIKKALDSNLKIYIRTNVDKDNIQDLPKLADVIVNEFSNNPLLHPYIYLLQDGGCSGDSKIMSEKIGIEEIYEMEKKYPQISVFYKRFHPSTFIKSIVSDEKFQPILRHCSASTNQYILDYKGNIYKCWHGIGNDNYSIGTFMPEIKINDAFLTSWQNRACNKIDKCTSCKFRYICGTGCPAAQHKSVECFDITAPYCVEYENLINVIMTDYIQKNS